MKSIYIFMMTLLTCMSTITAAQTAVLTSTQELFCEEKAANNAAIAESGISAQDNNAATAATDKTGSINAATAKRPTPPQFKGEDIGKTPPTATTNVNAAQKAGEPKQDSEGINFKCILFCIVVLIIGFIAGRNGWTGGKTRKIN
jgi:hypothetical protein